MFRLVSLRSPLVFYGSPSFSNWLRFSMRHLHVCSEIPMVALVITLSVMSVFLLLALHGNLLFRLAFFGFLLVYRLPSFFNWFHLCSLAGFPLFLWATLVSHTGFTCIGVYCFLLGTTRFPMELPLFSTGPSFFWCAFLLDPYVFFSPHPFSRLALLRFSNGHLFVSYCPP